jgi:hypothetical protein
MKNLPVLILLTWIHLYEIPKSYGQVPESLSKFHKSKIQLGINTGVGITSFLRMNGYNNVVKPTIGLVLNKKTSERTSISLGVNYASYASKFSINSIGSTISLNYVQSNLTLKYIISKNTLSHFPISLGAGLLWDRLVNSSLTSYDNSSSNIIQYNTSYPVGVFKPNNLGIILSTSTIIPIFNKSIQFEIDYLSSFNSVIQDDLALPQSKSTTRSFQITSTYFF